MMSYKFRGKADSGQWLSLLLPLCLFPMTIESPLFIHKFVFAIITWLSISHFAGRIIYLDKFLSFESHNVFYAIFTIPVAIFISWITSADATVSYLICLAAIVSYNYLISKLLIHCPCSFTIGEVQTIAQGIIIFILYYLISLKQLNGQSYGTMHNEAMDLLKLLLLGLLLLVCSLYAVSTLRTGIKIHCICFSFAIGMMLVWSFRHHKNLIPWFWDFCTYSHKRLYLLSFWLCLTLASVLFVIWINRKPSYRASTLDRKYFHIIINGVFLSGVIYDVQFLCFASGIALGAFIVLEIYRILEVPFIGPMIGQAFQIFLDEKDSGLLILTHIYLLIGCSSPIWLSSHHVNKNNYHISLLSGIISVGFGDTFAAVGGTLFGKHHWKGSKKTLEGTTCAIIMQLICSFFCMYIGHHFSIYNSSLVVASVLVTSLIEAKTSQVDNLVLPLVMFSFLCWID